MRGLGAVRASRTRAKGPARLLVTKAKEGQAEARPAMERLSARFDPTWTKQLNADPEAERNAPNKKSREVKSGHFVPVRPTPLPDVRYVHHSPAMAAALGVSDADAQADDFVRFFGGHFDAALGTPPPPNAASWATPYALSIMGNPQTQNCPFGTGNGYGDGRAISVAEVFVPSAWDGKAFAESLGALEDPAYAAACARQADGTTGRRWELQLKGGGTTPFCRGGDGRAVLRSSVREYLASEAMQALRVPTTRALVLVVSGEETSQRPWYSGQASDAAAGLSEDDPRLARFPPEVRRAIMMQYQSENRNPDVLVTEACAITTRVSPSFARVGHVDLFARRLRREPKSEQRKLELQQMVAHAIFREYPELLGDKAHAPPELAQLPELAPRMLRMASRRIADVVAGWLRVGFCQGNFNADNCLIGGRTMDYGPFGFMDEYDPMFAKWTGSGEHFAFLNQPNAGLMNVKTLIECVVPSYISDGVDEDEEVRAHVLFARDTIQEAVLDTWRRKFGFGEGEGGAVVGKLFKEMAELMQSSRADYTMMWRELGSVAASAARDGVAAAAADTAAIESACYAPLSGDQKAKWTSFVTEWLTALGDDHAAASARMARENPKFVPREWILVEAYTAAQKGDMSVLEDLFELFQDPYGEGSERHANTYYRLAPTEALRKGGTAFMT